MKYLELLLQGKTRGDKCQPPSAKSDENNIGTFGTDPPACVSTRFSLVSKKVVQKGVTHLVPKVTKLSADPFERALTLAREAEAAGIDLLAYLKKHAPDLLNEGGY